MRKKIYKFVRTSLKIGILFTYHGLMKKMLHYLTTTVEDIEEPIETKRENVFAVLGEFIFLPCLFIYRARYDQSLVYIRHSVQNDS